MNVPLVAFDGVALRYGARRVVEDLSFAVAKGDFWGCIGPNGSGKTSVLRAMLAQIRPARGRLAVADGVRFGYCRQRFTFDDILPFTAAEIVMMGRTRLIGPFAGPGPEDRTRVGECLAICGAAPLAGRRFADLSGGQKQRIIIARALAAEPTLLLLDEPTTDLDVRGTREILDLIADLRSRLGLTVFLVSHEISVVLRYAERFLLLPEGGPPRTADRRSMSAGEIAAVFAMPPNGAEGVLDDALS